MKRNEKIRAKEIEMQKQAAAKTNAQVNTNQVHVSLAELVNNIL